MSRDLSYAQGDLYNTYPNCKNLKFLLDFFYVLGQNPNSFSQLTENPASTSQALRSQLHNDDMKLSKAKSIMDILGYKLDVDLEEEEKLISNDDYILSLPLDLSEILIKKKKQEEHRNDNLGFLFRFLRRRRISKRALAIVIKMSPGAVFTWFQADDIAISYLFRIKDAYGVRLRFFVRKKNT